MDLLSDLWPLALLVLITTLVTEWATRSGKFPYWIGRKVLHFVAVGSCAVAPWLSPENTRALFWLILPIWLLLFALIFTNKLMKDEQGRPAWGIVWFPLAYLILLWFFPTEYPLILLPMLILAICDPLATIFGKLFGRSTYSLSGEPKSLIGNLAFFVSVVILLYWGYPFLVLAEPIDHFIICLILIACLLTLAEALGSYGSDNILVPLFAAYFLSDLQQISMLSPVIIILLASVPFVYLMVRWKKLTLGAAVIATSLAIIVTFKTDSYLPLLPLIFFFVSSLLLEKIFPSQSVASDAKDHQPRDIMQVVANGGIYGLVFLFMPSLVRDFVGIAQTNEVAMSLYETQRETVVLGRFLLGMGLVSLAVSTADTWASTIGKYFSKTAFDPFRWQGVDGGLSGGMTIAGTIAGLLGSISIATFLYILLPNWKLTIPHLIMISIAGFGGMLLDSLLGSRLQRQYYYDGRWYDALPEGATAEKTRGLAWMTNDVVNLVANLAVCVALGVIFLVR